MKNSNTTNSKNTSNKTMEVLNEKAIANLGSRLLELRQTQNMNKNMNKNTNKNMNKPIARSA